MRSRFLKARTAGIALTVLSGTGIAIGAAGTAFANETLATATAGCSSTYYQDAYEVAPLETVTWAQQDVSNHDLGDSSLAPWTDNQISSLETNCNINVVTGDWPYHPDFIHPYAWESYFTDANWNSYCGGIGTSGGIWRNSTGEIHEWRTTITQDWMGDCNDKVSSFSINIDPDGSGPAR